MGAGQPDAFSAFLSSDEPPSCEARVGSPDSPFVIVCDHAGVRLPRSLGELGLNPEERGSHIGWDIGAAEVARRLASSLDATLFLQVYSRLVIDCNRPLDAVDSIATFSERIRITGNENLDPAARALRARTIFHPYHERIRGELDRRQAAGRPVFLISMHSFTPVFLGIPRPWHAGILYLDDMRLAVPLLRALEREEGLVVGENEPYAASRASDYSIVEHGEKRRIPYVEIEVRQDLISDASGQQAWADRLARLLVRVAAGEETKMVTPIAPP